MVLLIRETIYYYHRLLLLLKVYYYRKIPIFANLCAVFTTFPIFFSSNLNI